MEISSFIVFEKERIQQAFVREKNLVISNTKIKKKEETKLFLYIATYGLYKEEIQREQKQIL